MRNKWIKKDGTNLIATSDKVEDSTRQVLQRVQETKSFPEAKAFADYRKRKLVTTAKAFDYEVKKGPKFATEIPIEVTDLTYDMLVSGDWEKATFKPYNFEALGAHQNAGALHPLNKVRKEFRDIFFHLGFTEMPTSRYVTQFNSDSYRCTVLKHSQLRRVRLLELRFTLRASATSCS